MSESERSEEYMNQLVIRTGLYYINRKKRLIGPVKINDNPLTSEDYPLMSVISYTINGFFVHSFTGNEDLIYEATKLHLLFLTSESNKRSGSNRR